MKVTDQIKILDKKIKQNKEQHDFNRKATKMSALSSNNLPKYEHLAGENLGYKPSALEQARFDYSPLSKFLKEGLKEEEKKEGPLQMLKNIEGKNEEQAEAIKDQGKNNLMKSKTSRHTKSLKRIIFFSGVSPKAIKNIRWAKRGKSTIDLEKHVCAKFDGTIFNLNTFKISLELASNIYYKGKISLEDAKKSQHRMLSLLNV